MQEIFVFIASFVFDEISCSLTTRKLAQGRICPPFVLYGISTLLVNFYEKHKLCDIAPNKIHDVVLQELRQPVASFWHLFDDNANKKHHTKTKFDEGKLSIELIEELGVLLPKSRRIPQNFRQF